MSPVNLADTKKRDEYLRVLGVGPSGVGKTLAFNSWPGKHLNFDFDKRHAPLIDWYQYRLADFDIEVIRPENFWTGFKDKINELIIMGDQNPYKGGVHIDSITTATTTTIVMQMIAKGAVGLQEVKREDGSKKKGMGGVKVLASGVAVPGWDEFNGEAMIFATLLEALKNLECNVFVTAHPVRRMAISGDSASKYESLITFGPKTEGLIPTYFDEVWYFDLEFDTSEGTPVVRRYCYTQPTIKYPNAKTAIKNLPAKIEYTNKSAAQNKNLYDVVSQYL